MTWEVIFIRNNVNIHRREQAHIFELVVIGLITNLRNKITFSSDRSPTQLVCYKIRKENKNNKRYI